MRLRDAQRALDTIYKAQEDIDRMNNKYPKMYKEALEDIAHHVIVQWYRSYSPIFYEREESLLHSYRIDLVGTELIVNFDKAYMDQYISREYNEYIYENSLKEGYHGGARSGITKFGEEHPHEGVPYWKRPFPTFKYWGRPALYTFSPYNRMEFLMKKKVSEIRSKQQDEYNKIIDKVKKAVDKLLT